MALTPGQSTTLSGAQNGGVFIGMLTVGIMATGLKIGALRTWVMVGCLGSCAVLTLICMTGFAYTALNFIYLVVALGFFNGMFAVAAIGAMMALASEGRGQREGTRMGLWGAAQAIAAGFGGLTGAVLVDIARNFRTRWSRFWYGLCVRSTALSRRGHDVCASYANPTGHHACHNGPWRITCMMSS